MSDLREALTALVDVLDEAFDGSALRIPNPGQRRAIVRAAAEARTALGPTRRGIPEDAWPSPGYIVTSTSDGPGTGLE